MPGEPLFVAYVPDETKGDDDDDDVIQKHRLPQSVFLIQNRKMLSYYKKKQQHILEVSRVPLKMALRAKFGTRALGCKSLI